MATKLKEVDAVIVGLGWTGGILAKELAEAGLNVVALERGAMRVRTAHAIGVMRTFSAFAASGICACGTYIVGFGSLLRPPSRTSPATPTI